jgi:flagellin
MLNSVTINIVSGAAGQAFAVTGTATTGGAVTITVNLAIGASGTPVVGDVLTSNQDIYDAVMALKLGSGAMAGLNVSYFMDLKITDASAALGGAATSTIALTSTGFAATKIERVGEIALETTRLYDIQEFWDSSGNFILANPQTIELVQGDGQKTSITLFDTDTIKDVKDKLNEAIYNGLGQKLIVDSSVAKDSFVSYDPWGTGDDGLSSVPGTFVIRSAMCGQDGKIAFVGDDPILRALSLQTIQKATETQFSVDVYEAHNNTQLAKDVKISGNNLIGVIHKDVDVQFSSNSGVKVTWDDTDKKFDFTSTATRAETFVHISDNTTVFHIGANQKQDIGVGIGDMSSRALGVNNILVTSNDQANIAIGKLDLAINRVSSERAKLGA